MGSDPELGVTPFANFMRRKAGIRNSYINSALAECLGTFIFVLFAVGAGCQGLVFFPDIPVGYWLTTLLGTALGLMVAIMVVGGVSGGHVNPAVTLAFAISGGISWIKVPIYWLAQFFGGYLGAGLAYWLYSSVLKRGCNTDLPTCRPETVVVFAPPAVDGKIGVAFADQVIGTALLSMIILSACDPRNMKVPTYFYGPLFGSTLAAINFSFGYYAGGVVNPARDISARLMALSVGYQKEGLLTSLTLDAEPYWVAPLFGPMIGGVVAALIYTLFITAHLKDPEPEESTTAMNSYVPNRFSPPPRAQIIPQEHPQPPYTLPHSGKYGQQPQPYRTHQY